MTSASSLRRFTRRIKLAERRGALVRRDRTALPFIGQARHLPKILLDTTVYIDQFQGRLPLDIDIALKHTVVWHSSVTASELSILAGLLDPRHPGTGPATERVFDAIDRRPPPRIITPDAATWAEAGILAGVLTRIQQYSVPDRRRTLNDALIYLSAARSGLTVLTRNVADFDLLAQLYPQGAVLFYEQ